MDINSSPDRKIWRYMEFTKFIDMLEHGALFFIRLDFQPDPWEAFVGIRSNDIDWSTIPKEVGDLQPLLEKAQDERRYRSMVSCWTINENESSAMWVQYGKSAEAIAIQSSYRRLKDSLASDRIQYREVSYGVNTPQKLKDQVFHKRPEFDTERELRAYILNTWDDDNAIFEGRITWPESNDTNEAGVRVPANLDQLIEAIYVAPNSTKWFHELVSRVLKKYGLSKKEVRLSQLAPKNGPFA
jgi:hypothetical protein